MTGKRGRPLGYRLSEESKRAISESKKGQKHKQETKDKISRTLLIYFRKKNPLSEEITNEYCRTDDDTTCDWVMDSQGEIDEIEDVKTERALYNIQRSETNLGRNIDQLSHELTPETLLLFKEFCEECGLDEEDIVEIMRGDRDEW